MASRSTHVILNNTTSLGLSRTYENLDHGIWSSNMLPPENIPAHQSGFWQAESDGLATGDQGTVKYNLDGVGEVVISWDNPFSGSNSYQASAPSGYRISQDGGDGNNATVTFTLLKE